jgi:hypothetical protein
LPFVIVPTLVSVAPTSPPGTLAALIFPPAAPSQRVSLVLNQQGASLSYTLPADPHLVETDTLTFNTVFPNPQAGAGSTVSVPAGTYLARVQVDSADSRLTVDGSGKFSGPTVTL